MFELITMPNTYYQSDKIYGLNTSDQLFGVVAAGGGSNAATNGQTSLTGLAALANQNVLAQAAALAAQQQAAALQPTQAQLQQINTQTLLPPHNFQIAGQQAQLAQIHQIHLQQQQQQQQQQPNQAQNSSAAMLAAALTNSSSSSASSSPSASTQPFLNGLSANAQQAVVAAQHANSNTSTSTSPTSLSSSSSTSSNQNLNNNGAQMYHQTSQSNTTSTTPTNLGSEKAENVRPIILFVILYFLGGLGEYQAPL